MTSIVYNSDAFAVVEFDVPADGGPDAGAAGLTRGGYEIVDKFARKEIFLDGAVAQHFKAGVEALGREDPTQEQVDDFIARYTGLAHQPLVLH